MRFVIHSSREILMFCCEITILFITCISSPGELTDVDDDSGCIHGLALSFHASSFRDTDDGASCQGRLVPVQSDNVPV